MSKLSKILPVTAFLMSLFMLPLQPAQASNHRMAALEVKGDKPVPKPRKPIGPPTSEE